MLLAVVTKYRFSHSWFQDSTSSRFSLTRSIIIKDRELEHYRRILAIADWTKAVSDSIWATCSHVGMQRADGAGLQTWARHTDFRQLRALSLETPVTRAALQNLIKLPLQSLHSLGLILDPRDISDHYSATLQTFVCNLPSLSHLRLTGALPSLAPKAILDHLGSALHTLYLIPRGKDSCRFMFDSSTIAIVTDSCKHVQDLVLSIRRA